MTTPNRLPFELDTGIDESLVTARAGVPLVMELFRVCGAAAAVDARASRKKRRRGLSASSLAEGLFALWTAGGERCEDLDALRSDGALAALLGHEIPASQTARDFLDGFHDEDASPLWAGEKSAVPAESAALAGLHEASRAVTAYLQLRRARAEATLDVDATILESRKQAARRTYDGRRGYQPVVVLWAEQDQIVAEEFRDGNVPAGSGNRRVVERAVASLPPGVERILVRGDSALYEQGLLGWLAGRRIEFAVSADLSRELAQAIGALPESAWAMDSQEADAAREWAEVDFVPEDLAHRKDAAAFRYLAIRVTKRQEALFPDGTQRRHFAVVTNRRGDGLSILRWHRKKAGTVEHTHHVLTNELAAEALPSRKFGANAAWFRLNAVLYNLLSAFKQIALPEELHPARPKRLRFLLFTTIGKVVRHGRETLLRLSSEATRTLYDRARLLISRPALAP
jgi:hypothetical protein